MQTINRLLDLFLAGDFQLLKIESNRALETSLEFGKEGNYGILYHVANIYIGVIYLVDEDISKSKYYLFESLNIPKNAAIGSFGPNTLLCDLFLMKTREFDSVRQFLIAAKKKSSLIVRLSFFRKVLKAIDQGSDPVLTKNNFYHLLQVPSKFTELQERIKVLKENINT